MRKDLDKSVQQETIYKANGVVEEVDHVSVVRWQRVMWKVSDGMALCELVRWHANKAKLITCAWLSLPHGWHVHTNGFSLGSVMLLIYLSKPSTKPT